MIYEYWTDGSTRNNGKEGAVGAYGFIRSDAGSQYEKVEVMNNATNQRCELMALIIACHDAAAHNVGPFDSVHIYTDSAYCVNCFKEGWYLKWQVNGWINSKKEPVANKDLWQQLIPYFEAPQYSFLKVKGHTGNTDMNDRIDKLVQNASMEANK